MPTRSVSHHARSRILQGQAALLALVFVASQLAGYLHAATEHHARCPEHGELIHVDAPAEAASRPAVATPAEDDHALRTAAADDHEHDHCYLCPVSRERLGTVPDTGALAAVLPAEIGHATPAAVAPTGRPRYIIAPKTSPPL